MSRDTTDPPARGQAVVIGASIAGLLAARVLSDHFDRVTILDRDSLPDQPALRKGVPQAQHIHVVLARGLVLLEELFPGLAAELSAAGAIPLEWGYDNLLYILGRWFLRAPTGFFTRACSRQLLEFTVRRRVAALENVRFLEKREAIGLLADESKSKVVGVHTRARGPSAGASGDDDTIWAGWVVDASGRTSRTPEWLQVLGYEVPSETKVNSFLGYASRLYTPPMDFSANWKAMILRGRSPYLFRGGVLHPIEDGRWLVTLSGAGRDYPPLDEEGFWEFVKTLGDPPRLAEALQDAQAMGPAVGYQNTYNQWRHYERLKRWPDNFVVLGDAACAFNPVYGQGMTIAGLDALTMDRCLREAAGRSDGRNGLARRFQRVLARGLTAPWLLATGEDYRVPQTEGPKPSPALRLVHAYNDRVALAASRHPGVFRTYLGVIQLLTPPAALFSPGVVARLIFDTKEKK